jgi:hypothetical protein
MNKPQKIKDLLKVVASLIDKGRYVETAHAKQRQNERMIILPDILYVLKTGSHEKQKDKFDEVFQTWNYAIRGKTQNEDDLRIIVSFDEEEWLLIITAFYIEERSY